MTVPSYTEEDRARQWLALQIADYLGLGSVRSDGAQEFADAILSTPGVEVQEMTMYVGKPGAGFIAETRLHIMLPVESVHV